MNHKLFKLMEEVVLVNKQIIIRFIPPLYTTSQLCQAKLRHEILKYRFTGESDQTFSNQYSIRGY